MNQKRDCIYLYLLSKHAKNEEEEGERERRRRKKKPKMFIVSKPTYHNSIKMDTNCMVGLRF